MRVAPQRYDLLGVGFGPSNLALCALFASVRGDSGWDDRLLSCFEQRPEFGWHSGMLLEGARMQVAFLKDLVTPSAPTSPYSFVNYLHEHGRLEHYINLSTFYPTRREYHDYFAWAARKLSSYVEYGRSIESIVAVRGGDGEVDELEVSYVEGAGRRRGTALASNLCLSVGGVAALPVGVAPEVLGEAAFHTASFLNRVESFHDRGSDRPYEFLVVGAGQSGAETFEYLARNFPRARVTLAFRGFSPMPANSSPLANEIFNPEVVDLFYGLPAQGRRDVLTALRQTNYAAADDEMIESIAALLYEQRVSGGDRLNLLRFREFQGCESAGDRVRATLADVHGGEATTADYDGVVFATGYDFSHAEGLLAELEPMLIRDASGQLAIGRDYSLETAEGFRPKIFLQGATEQTHGLTSTLISVLSHRASEVLRAAFGERRALRPEVESLLGAAVQPPSVATVETTERSAL